VFGAILSGSVAETIGTPWAIGGAAAVMLAYSYGALERRPELRNIE
jgi:hypothetical protein